MFFSSTGGLAAFFPDQVMENSYTPPVILTDFLLADNSVRIAQSSPLHQSISLTRTLTLEPKQNIFSFEFSVLSFANPARNRYRYRLEPLETAWKERDSSHRTVTYTTLPAGDYTFRVQGSNNRGTWNDSGANVHIRILPPWWATWTFRVACFLLAVAAILSLHLYPASRDRAATQLALRGAPGRADPNRTGAARYVASRLLERFDATACHQRRFARKFPREGVGKPDARTNGPGDRGRPPCLPRPEIVA